MKKTILCCICASVPLTIISGTQAAPLSREISNLNAPAYIIQAYCYQQCSYPDGDRWGPGPKVCTEVCKPNAAETPKLPHATTDSNTARILKTPSPNSPKIPGKP